MYNFQYKALMDNLGNRIKSRRKELGMSQLKLAKMVGMSQNGIFSIENGDVQRPKLLLEIARALKTTPNWILTGEEPKESNENFNKPLTPAKVVINVPVIGRIAEGRWRGTEEQAAKMQVSVLFEPVEYPDLEHFSYLVEDESLEWAGLKKDTYLICVPYNKTRQSFRAKDLIVMERQKEQFIETLARNVIYEGGQYSLRSYSDKGVALESIKCSGDLPNNIKITGLVVGYFGHKTNWQPDL